jgi:hypothetical protein
MAQGNILYNTKVENGGATVDGQVLADNLNEIKQVVNDNATDTETRVSTLELGTVQGPGSATLNAIALYDNVSGKVIKNSLVLVDGSGNMTGIEDLTLNGFLNMEEGAASPTPAAGYGVIYVKSSDKKLYFKDDAGTEYNVLDTGLPGNVVGPAGATDNALARFDTATGELLQDSPVIVNDLGNMSGVNSLSIGADFVMTAINPVVGAPGFGALFVNNLDNDNLYFVNDFGSWQLSDITYGDVVGPAGATDNALVRYDATTGKLVQDSVVILDDSGNLSGINDLELLGNLRLAEGSSPATPPNGFLDIYASSSDSKLYYINDAGDTFAFDGDFSGPVSSNLNAIVRFSDVSGKNAKNSTTILDDSGNITGLNDITATGLFQTLEARVRDTTGHAKVSGYRFTGVEPAASEDIMTIEAFAHDSTGYFTAGKTGYQATELWTNLAHGSAYDIWTIPNTTTAPVKAIRVDQDGGLDMLTHTIRNTNFLSMEGEIQIPNLVTPSNPPALYSKLYTKGDKRLYTLNETGIETALVHASLEDTLVDGANIPWNSEYPNAAVTLAGNRTLDDPTGMAPGYYTLRVTQDGAGSRTLAYGPVYQFAGGTPPTLTTTPGASDLLIFYSTGSTMVLTNIVLDVQ